MKPLIGITADKIREGNRHDSSPVYGQKAAYADAINLAGGIPVVLPIDNDAHDTMSRLDGVLFAGGNDIFPQFYKHQLTHARNIDIQRDAHEWRLMKAAHAMDKPILAICRGMQLLNVYRGGTLYQDIAQEVPDAMNHDGNRQRADHERLMHPIEILPESKLARILGVTAVNANSRHHQAARVVGEDLTAVAWANDGIIEAIEDDSRNFVVGVQPHPESLVHRIEPRWLKLFEAFVSASGA